MRTSTLGMMQQSVSAMLQMQNHLAKVQQQIAGGKKYLHNHESPVISSRIKNLHAAHKQLDIYQNNAIRAENRIALAESILTNMIALTSDTFTLHKKAQNGTLTDNERSMIAEELQQKLDEMMGLANSKDEKGEFLFSGFQGYQTPYTRSNGAISYHGDQGQRFIQISSSTFVPISESGDQLFNQVRAGNGYFTTAAINTPHSGTGVISTGSVYDFGGLVADTYTLEMVTNSGGELAYTITGATVGQIIPAPPALIPDNAPAFTEGENILFNGHEIDITGMPQAGDRFEIAPSANQDIFTTLQNIITALNKPLITPSETAEFYNSMRAEGATLDRGIEHMLSQLTRIGSQSAIVDNESRITADLMIYNQQTLSSVQDIDYASALSELGLALTALQAAQSSYAQLQKMSLLNYL